MDPLKLVQGDTRPSVVIQLTDALGPADLSEGGLAVRMKFRAKGTTEIIATLTGSVLTGNQTDPEDPTSIDYTSPYDVAGKGGRVQFPWSDGDLDGDPGNYEGEIEVTYADGSLQTAWDIVPFKMRARF